MWIYGYVGCGKSSLAQAVAELYARKSRLVGSFFFFRGSGDRCKTGRFAATIAGQLAAAIPEAAPYVEQAVRTHAGLLTTGTLGAQFEHMVYRPLKTFAKLHPIPSFLWDPYVVIIDGLDECNDHREIAAFIDHMLEFFKKHPHTPLRFLIASRVEEHLRTRLDSNQVNLLNLVDHTSLDDISAVVDATFTLAAKHDRVIQAYGDWPSLKDRQKLIEHSGGSVIFMSTILKFILGPSIDGLTPMERLPLALNINPGLDGLYRQTVSRSERLPHFFDIINAIMIFVQPHIILELANALGINASEVIRVLVNLHSILQVPGDDRTPVTICHTSLRDFMQDRSRSRRFYISSDHQDHVYICLLRGYEERRQPILSKIVTTVALAMEPLSIIQLACFLGLDTGELVLYLAELKAILPTPANPSVAAMSLSSRSFRSSFYHFLNAQGQSPGYFLSYACHSDLAYACFKVLSDPRLSPPSALQYARLHGMEHWNVSLGVLSGNRASFVRHIVDEAVARLRGCFWKRTAVDAVLCVLLTMEGAENTLTKPSGISMGFFAQEFSPIANEEQVLLIAGVLQEALRQSRHNSLVDIMPDIMDDICDMEDRDLKAVARAHLALLLWRERHIGVNTSPFDVLTDGDTLQRIVSLAQGSTVFVCEFAKFIMNLRARSPTGDIRTTISHALGSTIPLDDLYTRLLSAAENHDRNLFIIISAICSRAAEGSSATIAQVSHLLDIPALRIRSVLRKLRGIISLPSNDSTFFALPTPFYDFLRSRGRAGSFFVPNHLTPWPY